MNFAKNIEIFIGNGYCLLNSWTFQETLFYGIITFTCIHYFFKNNSQRHCRRPSGSILGLLMFCNLIIYSLFCQSQCITPAFITSRLSELEILDLILILKSQISDSVTSCLILCLKNQWKLHVNENRANVYKHKQTVATGVHHYKYITLHSIWAEAQKLDFVRELGGRVHYLKERKQKSASIKFL